MKEERVNSVIVPLNIKVLDGLKGINTWDMKHINIMTGGVCHHT